MTKLCAKRIVKKLTTSIPIFMSELVKKYAYGPVFFILRICTSVALVCAIKFLSEAFILPRISTRIQSRTKLSLVHNYKCIKSKSFVEPYSWIACQLQVGRMLAFLLAKSDFKSETSFGFLSQDYMGQPT